MLPNRNSKQTRIKQNNLRARSYVSIIGNQDKSAENTLENYSTLVFCSRCKDIKNVSIQKPIQVHSTQYLVDTHTNTQPFKQSLSIQSYVQNSFDDPSKVLESEADQLRQIIEFSIKLIKKFNQLMIKQVEEKHLSFKDKSNDIGLKSPQIAYSREDLKQYPLDIIKQYAQLTVENITTLTSCVQYRAEQNEDLQGLIRNLQTDIRHLKCEKESTKMKSQPAQNYITLKDSVWLSMIEYLFNQCRETYERGLNALKKTMLEKQSLVRQHCNLLKMKLTNFVQELNDAQVYDMLFSRINRYKLNNQPQFMNEQTFAQSDQNFKKGHEANQPSFYNNFSRNSSIGKNGRQSSSIDEENLNQLINNLIGVKKEVTLTQQQVHSQGVSEARKCNSLNQSEDQMKISQNLMDYRPGIQNDILSNTKTRPNVEKIQINTIKDQQQYEAQSYMSIDVNDNEQQQQKPTVTNQTTEYSTKKVDQSESYIKPSNSHNLIPSEKPNSQEIISRLTQKTREIKFGNQKTNKYPLFLQEGL